MRVKKKRYAKMVLPEEGTKKMEKCRLIVWTVETSECDFTSLSY